MRIEFGHDHARAERTGPHRRASSAPAVPCDHNDLAGNERVSRAHKAVPHRLTGAVTVVEQIFAVGVVDGNDRERQDPLFLHRLQALDAGGRLFRSASDSRDQFLHVCHHGRHQIGAVVSNDGRPEGKRMPQIIMIFISVHAVMAEHSHAAVDQSGADVVLSGKRIAAGSAHFRAESFKNPQQTGSFSFKMEAC